MKKNSPSLPGTSWFTIVLAFVIIKPILFIIFLFHHVKYLPHQKPLPKGPWLMMGNHHSNWDGLYAVMYYFNKIPHFMVHDALFQFRALGWFVLHWFGQINRGTINARWNAVRQLITYAKAGHTVGLFPEGDISMLGGSLPIDLSVAKLAKQIGLPIVLFRIKGAYQRAPRWANHPMRTSITIQTVEVLSSKEVMHMSLEQLHYTITQAIQVDAYDNEPIKVHSMRRAENLERALFCCPQCQSFFSLKTKNNDLWCQNCDWHVEINQNLTYNYDDQTSTQFPLHPKAHDLWQKNWLQHHLDKINKIKGVARVEIIENPKNMRHNDDKCEIMIDGKNLIIQNRIHSRIIPLRSIEYCRLIHRTSWEFTFRNEHFLVHTLHPSAPGYFWVVCIALFQ